MFIIILLSLFIATGLMSCGAGNSSGGNGGSTPKPFHIDDCFKTTSVGSGLEITGFESSLPGCNTAILTIPATRADGKVYVSIASSDPGVFAGNTVIEKVIGVNLESIGNAAFSGASKLANIDLPKVTTIGDGAFKNTIALTSISLANLTTVNNNAFSGASKLASIDLPKVTTIGDNAFFSTLLEVCNLPKVKTIGEKAFEDIPTLMDVIIGTDLTTIGKDAFAGGPNNPADRVFTIAGTTPPTTIGTNAFGTPGSEVVLPTTAASQAWENKLPGFTVFSYPKDNCFKTQAVDGGLEIIGFESTIECKSKVLAIPAQDANGKAYVSIGLLSEDVGVFEKNDFIESIIGGVNLKSIGAYAFYDASKLTTVNLPWVTTIGLGAFLDASKLEKVILPEAKIIKQDAFSNATALTSVNIPKVTTVEDSAFAYNKLTRINLPNVINLGNYAFYRALLLTNISIGPNLKDIGSNVFDAGSSPETITFTMDGTTPPTTIGAYAFGNAGSNIYVPDAAAVTAWTASTDPDFAKYIPFVKKQP